MANEAQKKRQRSNSRIFRVWLILSVVVTTFSAAMTYVYYPKAKRNKGAFCAGLTVTIIGILVVWDKIRVRKVAVGNKIEYVTNTDLSGGHQMLLDVIGIGLLVQFFGIWWAQSAWLFLLFPIFIIYTIIKKVGRWLTALG
jgi:hypothetical protein